MSEAQLNKSLDFLKNLKLGDAAFNSKIQRLYMQILESKSLIMQIESFADAYNFDQETPVNGFRSIIEVYFIAVRQALKTCDAPKGIRKIFMTKSSQINDIQNFCEMLDNFLKMFHSLIEHHKNSNSNELIAEIGSSDNIVAKTFNSINILSFYGKNIGFHTQSPSQFFSRHFSVGMALFGEFYYSGKNLLLRVLSIPLSAIKFLLNDRARALKNEELIRNADIDFLKVAYRLFSAKPSYFIQNIFNHSLKVNKEINLEPEPLQVTNKFKEPFDVKVPDVHIGKRPIKCHLFSAISRKGMTGEKSTVEPSKSLILHVHGGGFYTQSPQTHEIYLRDWAVKLNIPILSVNYSLAPRAPFPRALDEIFYVYCWLLKFSSLIGSTGANIVVVGDSAGANLITALVIKCIENGIKVPKGVFGIYGLYLSNYSAIPSMMLCFMDISLHYGHMMRIYKAYAGLHKRNNQQKNGIIPKAPANEFSDSIPKNHLMSPLLAPKDILKQFPKTILLSTNLDPCLDENIEMGKKLRDAGVDVKLDVLRGLIHGFLHILRGCKRSFRGSMICIQHIQELLETDS